DSRPSLIKTPTTAVAAQTDWIKERPSDVGSREIGPGERCAVKSHAGKVLAGEVAAGKIVVGEANSPQVTGLVTGRRVELGKRDSRSHRILIRKIRSVLILKSVAVLNGFIKARAVDVGSREIGANQRSAGKTGMGKISLAAISIHQGR